MIFCVFLKGLFWFFLKYRQFIKLIKKKSVFSKNCYL